MNCPKCDGRLVKASPWSGYDYDCLRCDRGWKITNGVWHAMFDASNTVYTPRKIKVKVVPLMSALPGGKSELISVGMAWTESVQDGKQENAGVHRRRSVVVTGSVANFVSRYLASIGWLGRMEDVPVSEGDLALIDAACRLSDVDLSEVPEKLTQYDFEKLTEINAVVSGLKKDLL